LALKEYTFLIFVVLMILFTIFVYLRVPETKNRTFEEIASQFQQRDDLQVDELMDDVFDVTSAKVPLSKCAKGKVVEKVKGHKSVRSCSPYKTVYIYLFMI